MSEMPLEQCYQILNLSPGADLEAVEAAYARKMMVLLRQGTGADKAQLKAAYHQLKDHTLLQAAVVAAEQVAANTPQQRITSHLNQRLQGQKIYVKVSLKDTEVQVQLQAEQTPPRSLAKLVYSSIRELDLPDLQTIQVYGMQGKRSIAWKQPFQLFSPGITQDDRDPFSFNNRFVTAFAFPAAILIAILTNVISIFKIFFTPLHIWIHEFGHATVAWLAGHRATPLPFGWTNVGEERSLIVYLCFLALLGLLFWSGWREQKRWVMTLAGVLAVIQFYMTWMMSIATYEMWLSFGGIGGEFYLSTLLIVCFYLPLPEKWRWDFWRYAVMLISANTFVDTFWIWHQIKRGTESIPWGTLFGGEGDAGGDMNRLSLDYNWSDLQIIQTYSQLGNLCLFILIGTYLYFLLKQNRRAVFKRR